MTEDEKKRRLQEALDRAGPTHTMADVMERLQDGRAQWWSNGDGMVVTEVWERPLATICNHWLIAGNLLHCLALGPEIENWARDQGCNIAMATGRKGWARIAPGCGWQPYGMTFFKPLAGGEDFAHGRRR